MKSLRPAFSSADIDELLEASNAKVYHGRLQPPLFSLTSGQVTRKHRDKTSGPKRKRGAQLPLDYHAEAGLYSCPRRAGRSAPLDYHAEAGLHSVLNELAGQLPLDSTQRLAGRGAAEEGGAVDELAAAGLREVTSELVGGLADRGEGADRLAALDRSKEGTSSGSVNPGSFRSKSTLIWRSTWRRCLSRIFWSFWVRAILSADRWSALT